MAALVSQTDTMFVGVLTKRQYKPGQRYVQLVFQTTQGIKVSLSRNVKLVRSLSVGKTYKIRGKEQRVGDKSFVAEPIVKAMPYELKLSHHRRLKWFAVIAIIVILAVAAYLVLGSHHQTPLQVTPTAHQVQAADNNKPIGDTSDETDEGTSNPFAATQTATTPATTTTTSTAPKTTTAQNSGNNSPANPSAPAASTPSQIIPYCNDPVDIPYGTTTTYDQNQDEGTVVTPGVVGSKQTCYDSSDTPTTTVITQPTDQVITTQTAPSNP